MKHVADFMGVPVYSDPSVPKHEMFIINQNDFKRSVGLKMKKTVSKALIAWVVFVGLSLGATVALFMYALVWSWR